MIFLKNINRPGCCPDCTDEPCDDCFKITMSLETRSASFYKYGTSGFEGTGIFLRAEYLTITFSSATETQTNSHANLPPKSCTRHGEHHQIITYSRTLPAGWVEDRYDPGWVSNNSGECPGGVCTPWTNTTTESKTNTNFHKHTQGSCTSPGGSLTASRSETISYNLSDEYTTDMLISDTNAYLETFPWQPYYGFPYTRVAAGMHITGNEVDCYIREIRLKFRSDKKIPAGRKAVITCKLVESDRSGYPLPDKEGEEIEVVINENQTESDWFELPVERERFLYPGEFEYEIKPA